MKKLSIFNTIFALLLIVACGDDELCDGKTCPIGQELNETTCECETPSVADQIMVSENIVSNQTWSANNVYILTSRIVVENGATLTIEPGTIIKGRAGAKENSTALIVARGGKIQAVGTASNPIIFTAQADNIQPGMIASPNLENDITGLWGGVIILGNAPISADAASVQIEGIPPSDQNGLYGGTNSSDNSGKLAYVSIRHGGTDIGEGNEINGLTLGGVGSGTDIHHIEVVANVDDGIEFFGGTVNAKHCLVWGQGDDAFDCDQGWSGTLDGFIGIAGSNSDHSLELDGAEGSSEGTFTLKNGSLKGYHNDGKDGGEYTDMRDGVTCKIFNCYFFNFSENSDFELDNEGVSTNYTNGKIEINNLQFNVSHLTEGNNTIESIFVDKSDLNAFESKPANATVITNSSVGADASQFDNWTLASNKNQLENF